ncbi:MAG: carbohydrate kinase family protein [Clostridia bacterium]|nr:carbohydrate kinase family protein [Clostridia bacterium]
MGKPRILVFGEVCKELNLRGCQEKDGVKYSDSYNGEPGGNGLIAAMTLSFYGNEAVLCSKTGADADGRAILKYLSSVEMRPGVRTDTRFITQSSDYHTPLHISMIYPDRIEKTVCRSPDYSVTVTDVDDAFMIYPDHVVVFDCLSVKAYGQIASQIERKGGELYIMSCPDEKALSRFGKCTLLSVDEKEAALLSGIYLKDQETCMRACMAISRKIQASYIVIRMSGRGYFIYDGTFYMFVTAYDLPKSMINDGDTIFCSVFIHAFIESGGDIKFTCEYANAASAAYIAGGLESLPDDMEIRKFAERNGTKL